MSVRLRPMASGEAEALCAVEAAARRRYGAFGGALAFVTDAPGIAPERFSAGETLVAATDDEALGYVILQPLDGLLYVASIAVAPEAGGAGIGAALMRAAEERASALDLGGTSLATFREPPWNGPWFRRLGYEPIPPERIGAGLAAILARHASFLDPSTREALWKPNAAWGARRAARP